MRGSSRDSVNLDSQISNWRNCFSSKFFSNRSESTISQSLTSSCSLCFDSCIPQQVVSTHRIVCMALNNAACRSSKAAISSSLLVVSSVALEDLQLECFGQLLLLFLLPLQSSLLLSLHQIIGFKLQLTNCCC